MKLLSAFFRLVRWPNLVFIALTQVLFVYCILFPVLGQYNILPVVRGWVFVLLCLSSVLIAAAGYIINDYFDLNIDEINKPDKLIVDKIIPRRWTIILHLLLSIIGILIGVYLDLSTPIIFLSIANLVCVLLLFYYSISLKRKLLAGNVLISLLTAWVILVITFCETRQMITLPSFATARVMRFTFLYSGFAFIISLIREVVKDMEDVEGDRRYGCTTMPIAWGMNAAKIFVAVWLVVLIAVLVIVQFYVLQFHWWWSAIYCLLLIIVPLIYVLRKFFHAHSPADFHKISSLIKFIMFTGILSMIFIKIYS